MGKIRLFRDSNVLERGIKANRTPVGRKTPYSCEKAFHLWEGEFTLLAGPRSGLRK
jgi:hypothetical protein